MSNNGLLNLKNNMAKMGINLEVSEGENVFPTARVKNDPINQKTEEIKLPPASQEIEDKRRENEIKIIKRRMKNFTEGVHIFSNLQKINIEEMEFCAENWNYFGKPSREQLLTLIGSIEHIGLINPLILLKELDNSYTIISGKSRVIALRNLYNNTKDEKYKYAPAFVLNCDEIDEYYLRMLIIDSNLPYRTISQGALITAVIERYEFYKRTNEFRSETKIAEALADEFLVSRSTIFNYLSLRNLREEIMVLLLEKRIKIEAAKYLARVNPSLQLMILENFGIEHINELHRTKYLTSKDNIKLPELLRRIEVAKELVPFKTKITITVNKYVLPECLRYVGEIKKYAIINFEEKFETKNCDNYCKVSVNYEDMKYYLEKEIINKSIVELISVKNYDELKRV